MKAARTVVLVLATAILALGAPPGVAAATEAPPGEVHRIADVAGADPGAPVAEPSVIHRGPLDQHGRWYVDGDGRAFLTAGVNMVYKHPPYTPEAAGFDAADADWLAANGFDSVRLGIIWKAVEPRPGEYDDAYLAAVGRSVEQLTSRGIAVLIDAHQDMYHEDFQGEFAPDWAVIDDGLPSAPQVGFPANQALNIGLIRAYDNFLANREGPGGVGLQDRYAAMWGHVAGYFAQRPGIMGYDILNEPWPGSAYPLCYLRDGDCGAAQEGLDRLHRVAAEAIVAADPDAIVHYEPYSVWNMGLDARPARPASRNAAFSWHVYCPVNAIAGSYAGCDLPDERAFANASRLAEEQDSATLLSEFGATDDAATLTGVLDRARAHLTGWQYWSYCGCDDPTTQNQREQGIVDDPSRCGPVAPNQVNRDKLAILAAPHARAVAGTPESTGWDATARIYRASWTPERVDGTGVFPAGSVTEIAVPEVNYPDGYRVEVEGGTVISEPDAPRLLLAAGPGERTTVRVLPA